MSGNICHQIVADFLQTILTYEGDLEKMKIALAENANFDIFFCFQTIDATGNGYIDNKDLRALFESHGIKIKKEEVEHLNRNNDNNLKITYKEFLNHLLPNTSPALREKALNQHYSHKNLTATQSNDKIVEDKIIAIYTKRIEYAKALKVFSTYDVEPVDLKDCLFEFCEESTGYLEHKRLDGLMKRYGYDLEQADFLTVKRVIGSFWETKLTPASVISYMLPEVDLKQTSHFYKEERREPEISPEEEARKAFYAERPHLASLLSMTVSPSAKQMKTVKFSILEDNVQPIQEQSEGLNTNETRPSYATGSEIVSFRSPNKQPEVLIRDSALQMSDLRNKENKPAQAHIFESSVGGFTTTDRYHRSSPRGSANNEFVQLSSKKHEEAILRESSKIKSQYDDKLAAKRELLNASRQKRMESSVSMSSNVSPKQMRNIVNGMTTINSVYLDNTHNANSSRGLNYSLSGKYTNNNNVSARKSSRSPTKRNGAYEEGYRLTNYANSYGNSAQSYKLGNTPTGLYELRENDHNNQEGPRVIDDSYLKRLNYLLDKKEAERDSKALQLNRTVSFQPTQSSPLEPTYQNYNDQVRTNTYENPMYTGSVNYNSEKSYYGSTQDYYYKESNAGMRSNMSGLRSSPKRDILLDNEVSVLPSVSTQDHMKIGSYRFGKNFYDRMLP